MSPWRRYKDGRCSYFGKVLPCPQTGAEHSPEHSFEDSHQTHPDMFMPYVPTKKQQLQQEHKARSSSSTKAVPQSAEPESVEPESVEPESAEPEAAEEQSAGEPSAAHQGHMKATGSEPSR